MMVDSADSSPSDRILLHECVAEETVSCRMYLPFELHGCGVVGRGSGEDGEIGKEVSILRSFPLDFMKTDCASSIEDDAIVLTISISVDRHAGVGRCIYS